MYKGCFHNTIKSHIFQLCNQQTGKWLYYRSYPTKVRVLSPQGRLFSLKAWHQGEKSTPLPRAFGFDGQRSLRAGAPQDRGKPTLSCFCIHTRFCVYWDRAVTPEEPGLDLPESLGESPGQVGSVFAHWGARRMVAEGQRLLSRVSSTRGHHFGSKAWTYQMAYRLQCQNATVQASIKKGTQPNPWEDRVP